MSSSVDEDPGDFDDLLEQDSEYEEVIEELEEFLEQGQEERSTGKEVDDPSDLPYGPVSSGLLAFADLSDKVLDRSLRKVQENSMKIGGSIAGLSLPVVLSPSNPSRWVSEESPEQLNIPGTGLQFDTPVDSYEKVKKIAEIKDEWFLVNSEWGDGWSWKKRLFSSTDNWAHLATGYFLGRGMASTMERYSDIGKKKIALTAATAAPAAYFLAKEGYWEGSHMVLDFALNNPDVQGDAIMDAAGSAKGAYDFLDEGGKSDDEEEYDVTDSFFYRLGSRYGALEKKIPLLGDPQDEKDHEIPLDSVEDYGELLERYDENDVDFIGLPGGKTIPYGSSD